MNKDSSFFRKSCILEEPLMYYKRSFAIGKIIGFIEGWSFWIYREYNSRTIFSKDSPMSSDSKSFMVYLIELKNRVKHWVRVVFNSIELKNRVKHWKRNPILLYFMIRTSFVNLVKRHSKIFIRQKSLSSKRVEFFKMFLKAILGYRDIRFEWVRNINAKGTLISSRQIVFPEKLLMYSKDGFVFYKSNR